MKKILVLLLSLSLLLSFPCMAWGEEFPTAASPSNSGALRVSGNCLVGQNGEPVQLKGISTHGIHWYPQYINQNAFREFRRDWHMNVIRLAMYTEEGGYVNQNGQQREQTLQLVHEGIQYALEMDMYAIIDWHILSDGNPNYHLQESKDFFSEISAYYKDANHVIYEICNEPNGNVSWEEIKRYAEEIIPCIRSNDPDALILVGTPNWSQYVREAAANPITDYDNIMYTMHFYAATHGEDLRQALRDAHQAGLPVFVSEFGVCEASGNGYINEAESNAWLDMLDMYGISYVLWNLSNKNEASAIISPACQKTYGFEMKDLSPAGTWYLQRLLQGWNAEAQSIF